MPGLKINKLRENVFFIFALLYVLFIPYSEALVSITAVLLMFQSIVLSSWKHPSVKERNPLSLLLIISIFGIYLTGLLYTEDLAFGIYELKKVSFWIVLPVAFYFSPRLNEKRFYVLLLLFCFAVLVASLIAFGRLVFSGHFHFNNFREMTVISHIRFSIQVVLASIIITYFLIAGKKLPFKINVNVLILVLIWFAVFLILLKALTGLMAFIGTGMVVLTIFILRIKKKQKRAISIVFLILLFLVPVLYFGFVWVKFYSIEKLEPEKVEKYTASGNPYYFNFSSTEKENGNWVKAYINEKELRQEWNKRSEAKYDTLDKNGYPYSATLIRYLTSKGLRKDSAGVSKLNDSDIVAVQNGIANYIYADNGFSIYPRVYQVIWELDRYLSSGNPNFQSISQRIEFLKASVVLIQKNPWLGIGTGNWKIKYAEVYKEMDSKLIPENQGPAHNQYFNYLVKFGIIGFVAIYSMLIVPVFLEGNKRNLMLWLFFVAFAIANLSDANFETHMGLTFFCFFYCLFLWHSPLKMKTLRI